MDIPEIVEILPTNLPAVEANEMRLDNLFRLKDGTIVIVDYESTYSYADKIKYLNYVARTTKRYGLSEKQNQPVRMIVIYTGSIRRGTTRADVDMGCLQFTVEEVFPSDLDAQEIETRFQRKIHSGEILSDEEQMSNVIAGVIRGQYDYLEEHIYAASFAWTNCNTLFHRIKKQFYILYIFKFLQTSCIKYNFPRRNRYCRIKSC